MSAQTKIVLKTFPDLVSIHKKFPVDFFEVSVRPVVQGVKTSLEQQLDAFEPISHKVIGIHGAIYREGVNLLDPAENQANLKAFNYTLEASKVFKNFEYIVFHPGHMISNSGCSFDTLFAFLKTHSLPKLMIEFEPFFSYSQRLVFPIHSVSDWVKFQQKIQKPILLDTAHCFVTANALGYDYYDYFSHLTEVFDPKVIHISNTDMSDGGINDKHLPLKNGVIDFKKLRHCFENRTLVIEVNGISKDDIFFLEEICNSVVV
jgi:endonuclease IV